MPPAAIFILRHGERQDHVNPQWKKTATRAHDPPLTPKGVAMASAVGQHYFSRLMDYAYSLQDAHPQWPALSDVADGAVTQLLQNTVILSSPLTRCVQTSHQLADALMGAARGRLDLSDTDEPRSAAAAQLPLLKIVVEDTLVEEDKWMGIDLREAPTPQPSPLLYDAATHASNTSPLVCVRSSTRPSALCATQFAFDSAGRVVEYDPKRVVTTKGKTPANVLDAKITVQERCLHAATQLVGGTIDHLVDGKLVFVVSHGKTAMTWYNALTGGLYRGKDGNVMTARSAFDGAVPLTGIAELRFLPESGTYVSVGTPFATPHLTEA